MAAKSMERAAARAQGLSRYVTGRPCKNGHIAERATSTGLCCECKKGFDSTYYSENKDKFREDGRRWRNENRDRYRKQKREWAAKNSEKIKPYRKAYDERNKDRLRGRLNAWRSQNPDKAKEQGRRYRANNPDSARAKYHRWAAKNRDLIKILAHKRRARLLQAEGSHTPADLRALLKAQNHRCAYCAADLHKVKKHLDHRTPLSRGGSNDKSNLIFACMPCNLSKGARDEIEYGQQMGRLL
jgi:5-methylcytosine-specific restriction endonuclease McrA